MTASAPIDPLELADELRVALGRDDAVSAGRAVLLAYRDRGLTQRAACTALEGLRAAAYGTTEDRILELLDIATGWCQVDLRVWEDTGER